MPPLPTWYQGRDAIGWFIAGRVFAARAREIARRRIEPDLCPDAVRSSERRKDDVPEESTWETTGKLENPHVV